MSWNLFWLWYVTEQRLEEVVSQKEIPVFAIYVGEMEDRERVGDVWEGMWEKKCLKCSEETEMQIGKCTLGIAGFQN